jgi:hypothetical protein
MKMQAPPRQTPVSIMSPATLRFSTSDVASSHAAVSGRSDPSPRIVDDFGAVPGCHVRVYEHRLERRRTLASGQGRHMQPRGAQKSPGVARLNPGRGVLLPCSGASNP